MATDPLRPGGSGPEKAEQSWRCFHCGLLITDEHHAREHFGLTREAVPDCLALDHPAVQRLKHLFYVEQRQMRDALSDLVDACYSEGSSASWRVCNVCNMEHRPDEAMLGDQTHVKDCVVDAAEKVLRRTMPSLSDLSNAAARLPRETPQEPIKENNRMSEIPRRAQMEQWTSAEKAIYDACLAVEAMPADVRLTDAVTLLGAAKDSVADFVDGVETRRLVEIQTWTTHLSSYGRSRIASRTD